MAQTTEISMDETGNQKGFEPVVDENRKQEDLFEDSQRFATELAAPAGSKSSKRKRRRLHCFECNRHEGHVLHAKHRWFYSFLLGLTFGLAYMVGPYQCQCCGAKRLLAFDGLHPKHWFRTIRNQRAVKTKSR